MLATRFPDAAAPDVAELDLTASHTPLPSPAELRAALPLCHDARRSVEKGRRALRDVLSGRDPRLVVIVGPCSLHDRAGALEYARRLQRLALEHSDALVVVMRTYVEKPRTTVGWKGLVNDPRLDGSSDIATGLRTARELLLAINQLGVPCATELLDPIAARYLEDLVAWGGIGARTVESQTHRELASGFPAPVGVKNATDGSVQSAVDAIVAARAPHQTLSIDERGAVAVRRSPGNRHAHVVLRGGRDGPNCDRATLERAAAGVARTREERPVLVDCSHGNSGKDYRRQGDVLTKLLDDRSTRLAGVLLESNLREGRQDAAPGKPPLPGLSITDACIGWDETERLLSTLAQALRGPGTGGETAA